MSLLNFFVWFFNIFMKHNIDNVSVLFEKNTTMYANYIFRRIFPSFAVKKIKKVITAVSDCDMINSREISIKFHLNFRFLNLLRQKKFDNKRNMHVTHTLIRLVSDMGNCLILNQFFWNITAWKVIQWSQYSMWNEINQVLFFKFWIGGQTTDLTKGATSVFKMALLKGSFKVHMCKCSTNNNNYYIGIINIANCSGRSVSNTSKVHRSKESISVNK